MAAPRMPAEFVTRYWDLPYGRMRSRSLGQRRPGVPDVVLVMGMAVADYLMPALATLGEWTRGHLVEFPGYAGSGEPPEPLDVPGFGAAVTAWLEAADLGPVELAGHSSGTQVAARAAAQAGRQLIERLVLASPTVDPVARSAPRLLLHWRLDGRREPPGLTESHKPESARAGVRGIRHLVRVHLAEQAPAGRFEQMPGAHTFPWLDPAAWSTPIRCLVDAPPA